MIEQVQTITTVTLTAMTREGDALADITELDTEGIAQTRTVHVPAGLPGERVTIAIEAPAQPRPGKRRHHWKPRPPRIEITEIQEASPLRTETRCPVFGTCGGCQLQHMEYTAQLAWKRSIVAQLLHDSGGFENPPLLETVPCDNPWHYRNHMRFSVNRHGQPGLTARGTHRVLPLTSCPIADEQINSALNILSQFPNERPQVLIRCGTATGQMLIQPSPKPEVLTQLQAAGLDIHADSMEEQLAGQTFRIRPSSFFQTNTAQAEKMVEMVLKGLLVPPKTPSKTPTRGVSTFHDAPAEADNDILGATKTPTRGVSTFHDAPAEADTVDPTCSDPLCGGQAKKLIIADTYCGVGTFARILAQHVGKVIAIEESASAIKDAQWNLREVNNVELLKGKVEELLPSLAAQLDGLVIDPPRAGCQQVVLDALIQHPIPRVVYVSCDPSTLARDLNILCHVHPIYHLHSVQPLDMFPQTAHIECVAVLERQ